MLDIHEIISFFRDALGQFADRSAKWLLANPDNLRGLLEIIGEDLVESLDFSRVQNVNTTFIADNLREQESDMVFLLPFRDTDETEVMIYILIEHQSTIDPAMGFRILSYMYHIWDQQRQQWVAEDVSEEPVAISSDHSRRALHWTIRMEICDFNGSTDDSAGTAASIRAEIRYVISRYSDRTRCELTEGRESIWVAADSSQAGGHPRRFRIRIGVRDIR